MARATPANDQIPEIGDGEGENNTEDSMVETNAAEALTDLHRMSFGFTKNSGDKASSSKFRFAHQSEQPVSGTELMHIDQTGNDVFVPTTNMQINPWPKDHMAVDEQLPKASMFTKEELSKFTNIVKVEENLVEVMCACSSKNHGDYVGKMMIHRDGEIFIDCKCLPDCTLENAKPELFASHAKAKLGPSQWQKCIWVHSAQGLKIKLLRSPFLRYFNESGMKILKRKKLYFHRDEFLKCSLCGVDRRFKQNTSEDCRAYHDAALRKNSWTCSQHPHDKIDCRSEGERASRKPVRGCPRVGTCQGCRQCACLGCTLCRFPDCGCQVCVDFTRNT